MVMIKRLRLCDVPNKKIGWNIIIIKMIVVNSDVKKFY